MAGMRLASVLAIVCVSAVLFASCGGSSPATSSEASVISCFKSSGPGKGFHDRQVPPEAGGLPTHHEIVITGFAKSADSKVKTFSVLLFQNRADGVKGAEKLEEEDTEIEIYPYAGYTAIAALPKDSDFSRDRQLIGKCTELSS